MKIHLVQMSYLPAYFMGSVDFLAEPAPLRDTSEALGLLTNRPAVVEGLARSKREYIDELNARLRGILYWSLSRSANLIVFPEYSIPVESLELLHDFAQQNDIALVGGSHRVRLTPETLELYGKV